MKVKINFFGQALLVLGVTAAPAVYAEDVTNSLVKIAATVQTPDFDSPWKFNRTQTADHMGIVVAPNRVLVTARAVGYSTMLTLERFGLDEKVPMVVETVDYSVNLAILKPLNDHLSWNPSPIAVADDMDQEDKPLLYATGRQRPSPIAGFVRDYSLRSSGTSSYTIPFYSMEVRPNSGLGWSEPVILNGKLAGISAGQNQNTIFVIPPKILRHFLTDALSGQYRGFGRLGITYSKLSDPTMRRYYNLDESQSGVLVTDVGEQSPFFDLVKQGDILTQIDQVPITINGYYKHKKWGYVDFADKVVDFFAGDDVSLTVVRQGKSVTVSAPLTRYIHTEDYVPKYRYEDEPYIIFGGLVFQELSQGYMEAWGTDWAQRAPAELLFVWQYGNKPKKDRKQKIIVLGKVLPDTINQGYQSINDLIVGTINGQKIDSLADVEKALAKPISSHVKSKTAEHLAQIKFAWDPDVIVLSYKDIDKAHERIRQTYGLGAKAHFAKLPAKIY